MYPSNKTAGCVAASCSLSIKTGQEPSLKRDVNAREKEKEQEGVRQSDEATSCPCMEEACLQCAFIPMATQTET